MTSLGGAAFSAATPALLAQTTSRGAWRPSRMHAYLDRRLLDVAAGRTPRLVISAPPRHGKSSLASRYFPAWFLGTLPDRRVILVSYEASFAASWGRKVRDLLEEHGQRLFGVCVRSDVRGASEFEIVGRDGGMITAGVNGPITGRGGDLIVIDDPIKNQTEAVSQHLREKIWDWYETTLRTRLEPAGAIVVMMTRWHHEDLAGRLLAGSGRDGSDAWEEVALRAIAEEDDVLGRTPGSPLFPERWSLAALEKVRASCSSETWEALYQQRPSKREGGAFKRQWFRYYDSTPDCPIAFLTVDLAASLRETADYTVVAAWGLGSDRRLYLLDLARARLEGPDIVPLVRRIADERKASAVWIERVGFQLSLVQEARRASLPVRELAADKDKMARALPATAWLEGGRVLFPRGAAFLADFEDELCAFPRGGHDDQVDVLSYAVAVARDLVTDSTPIVLPFEPLPYTPYGAVELSQPSGW